VDVKEEEGLAGLCQGYGRGHPDWRCHALIEGFFVYLSTVPIYYGDIGFDGRIDTSTGEADPVRLALMADHRTARAFTGQDEAFALLSSFKAWTDVMFVIRRECETCRSTRSTGHTYGRP
jgi:hypothetical protein